MTSTTKIINRLRNNNYEIYYNERELIITKYGLIVGSYYHNGVMHFTDKKLLEEYEFYTLAELYDKSLEKKGK